MDNMTADQRRLQAIREQHLILIELVLMQESDTINTSDLLDWLRNPCLVADLYHDLKYNNTNK